MNWYAPLSAIFFWIKKNNYGGGRKFKGKVTNPIHENNRKCSSMNFSSCLVIYHTIFSSAPGIPNGFQNTTLKSATLWNDNIRKPPNCHASDTWNVSGIKFTFGEPREKHIYVFRNRFILFTISRWLVLNL